jgi:hypothetical protein
MGNEPRVSKSGEGRSIASLWGDMVAEAQRGEVVAVTDKWGNDVAVMVSLEKFEELTGIDLRQTDDDSGAG